MMTQHCDICLQELNLGSTANEDSAFVYHVSCVPEAVALANLKPKNIIESTPDIFNNPVLTSSGLLEPCLFILVHRYFHAQYPEDKTQAIEMAKDYLKTLMKSVTAFVESSSSVQ